MKKILALMLTIAMIFCVCGCNDTADNTSSDVVDVEVEEIIVDESGNTITSSEDTTTSDSNTSSDNSSSNQTSTPGNNTSSDISSEDDVKIDYNTVVEVDICDDIIRGYLYAKDVTNQFNWLTTYSGTRYDNQVLPIQWKLNGGPYTIYISENADFSDAYSFTTNSIYATGSACIPGKTYYWKVIGGVIPELLGGGKIKIKDEPVRWLTIDGVGNVRDAGGWKTASGKTVKYGMLYRGRRLESVTQDGIATIKYLGIKTELDLRYADQKFQTPGTGLNYQFIEHPAQYENVLNIKPDVIKASYKKIFELLSDPNNYPFYAHCNAGADRTGTFVFIANGLLGVSYEDLTRDFELTSFSESGKRWRADSATDSDGEMTVSGNHVAWGKLYDGMMDYGSKNGCTTLQSSIEHWLINYIGVPQSQIDSFKNIMLE